MRTLLLAATLLALLATPSSFALEAAPVNDDFADAVVLGAAGKIEGTNIAATEETGEPDHAGNPGGRSVWYTWTAPGDGSVPQLGIVVEGDYDTVLAVYTGTDVGSLTEVASNDDVSAPFFVRSSVSFSTTAGETYAIAVDGFGGKSGRFTLSWREAPPNDNFDEAVPLAGASGSRTGDTARDATAEHGEPLISSSGRSVWYSWTPPADGTYKVATTNITFDTVLAIYEGSSLETLERIRVNDDDPDRGCCTSWVPLVNADATTTYMIKVEPLSGRGGAFGLEWSPLILGTNGPDNLLGTAAADEIRGRGGGDVIAGGGGNDVLFGGGGNDVVRGEGGADFLLDRFAGDDLLAGGNGDDVLNTRDFRGGDRLRGGRGDDRCRADRGDSRRSC